MLKMNDVVALGQFAEIDLRAMAFGASQASSGVCGKSTEQFRGVKNDEVSGGKTKAARERTFDKIDIIQGYTADDFAETLDLALSLKINDDERHVLPPVV